MAIEYEYQNIMIPKDIAQALRAHQKPAATSGDAIIAYALAALFKQLEGKTEAEIRAIFNPTQPLPFGRRKKP